MGRRHRYNKFPSNTEDICETQEEQVFGTDTMPIKLSTVDRAIANHAYDHWAQSLDQYEASPDVSAFSSKFDAFLDDPHLILVRDEMAGFKLFKRKATATPTIRR